MAKDQFADLNFQNVTHLYNLPAPTTPTEPARLIDLQQAIEGLAWKDDVRVSTQGNLNLASPGASIDGIAMAANDRVLVRFQTTAADNGLYYWTGAATPMTRTLDANAASELNAAVVGVDSGTDGGTTWRQGNVLATLGTDAINFGPFGTTVAPASTTTAGKVRLATQAEVDAGTDPTLALSPATFAGAARIKKLFTSNIGDGSATQIDVTHNFGTRDVTIAVMYTAGNYAEIDCEKSRPTVNTVRLNFSTAPAANALRVVILG